MKNMPMLKHIHSLTKQLQTKFDDATLCTQYAWWLMQAVTNKPQAELLITETLELSPAHEAQLHEWVQRIVVDDMPLQYILGSVPFGDVDILVKPPILIPRPETEERCMWLIHKLNFLHNKT